MNIALTIGGMILTKKKQKNKFNSSKTIATKNYGNFDSLFFWEEKKSNQIKRISNKKEENKNDGGDHWMQNKRNDQSFHFGHLIICWLTTGLTTTTKKIFEEKKLAKIISESEKKNMNENENENEKKMLTRFACFSLFAYTHLMYTPDIHSFILIVYNHCHHQ